MDKLRTHKQVIAWLAATPRIHVHVTPTSAVMAESC